MKFESAHPDDFNEIENQSVKKYDADWTLRSTFTAPRSYLPC